MQYNCQLNLYAISASGPLRILQNCTGKHWATDRFCSETAGALPFNSFCVCVRNGLTPLMWAARNNHLQAKAICTPCCLRLLTRVLQCVLTLLRVGASIETQGPSPTFLTDSSTAPLCEFLHRCRKPDCVAMGRIKRKH